MTKLKELHLGRQIKDLERLHDIPDIKTKKIPLLLESGKKIYREAERHYLQGDEELAYVYYMKYFNLLNGIHKKPDYAQHKQTVRQVLGGNKLNKEIMDKVELLNNSLKMRYEKLNESKVSLPISAVENELETHSISPMEAKPNEDVYMKNIHEICCKDLYNIIQNNSVLIMDCRPREDYNISHLTYQWAFNVPEEYISKGMSAGKLQDKLDTQSKNLWSARSVKDHVVIMDWSSKSLPTRMDTPSAILLDILQNWDPDTTYRSPIRIVMGGYEYFIMMYPTLCTNPSIEAPKLTKNNEETLEDIEYPSIHDITMKNDVRDREFTFGQLTNVVPQSTINNQRPVVDRSSKLGAMKIYKQKIDEIVKEQEELLQTAKFNDEQIKETTEKLNSLYEVKNDEDLITEEQKIKFNLMQLESAAEDDSTKTNFLLDQLDKYKARINQQQEQIPRQELLNLEEYIKQVENRLREIQELNERRIIERQQREISLNAVRGKQQLRSVSEDEESLKPRLPSFDRSTKPTIENVSKYTERIRDFSPVSGKTRPGITGLKNLGNTCYMNSIVQCLSNTPQLTEYCIFDSYKKYICRSNKTKGQVIEEFAALLKMLWSGKYKYVACKDLYQTVALYHKMFCGYEQQDSHEFLTILMDWLHSDLQTLEVQQKAIENISASEKSWMDFTKSRESIILRLFYGQIKSTVKCVACNKESATYESFSNLSLELPTTNNVCDLYQCMDMYFSGENIHGWNCPSCKDKRDAIKKLDISKLPPVLVIHLKRFYADATSGTSFKKKQNYVHFPLNNLDISSYIAKSESRTITPKSYDLYSVSNHYGSMESGHYTAFAKNGKSKCWLKYDDQLVTPLESSNVVSSAAYILFYTWLPSIQI